MNIIDLLSTTLDPNRVLAIAAAAEAEGVPYPIAAAFADLEGDGGQHIYGHDLGGTFSTASGPVTIAGVTYPTGADIEVTEENYAEFKYRVLAGGKSNGVGIFQITYAGGLKADGTRTGGYLTQADTLKLDLSLPLDNARFGLRIIEGNIRNSVRAGFFGDDAIRRAAVLYNQGNPTNWQTHPYGTAVVKRTNIWRMNMGQSIRSEVAALEQLREDARL